MTVSQLSIFLQNSPGHLASNLELLETNGISLKGYNISDTGDYGILRIIVDNPISALEVLKSANIAVVNTSVLCIKLPDNPGELLKIAQTLNKAGINIDYSYSLIDNLIVVKTSDDKAALKSLTESHAQLIENNQL